MTAREIDEGLWNGSRAWTQASVEFRASGNEEAANAAGRMASFYDAARAARARDPRAQRAALQELLDEINRVKTEPGALAWARFQGIGTGTLTGDVSEVLRAGANLVGSAINAVGRGLGEGLGLGPILLIAALAWVLLKND